MADPISEKNLLCKVVKRFLAGWIEIFAIILAVLLLIVFLPHSPFKKWKKAVFDLADSIKLSTAEEWPIPLINFSLYVLLAWNDPLPEWLQHLSLWSPRGRGLNPWHFIAIYGQLDA